MRNTKRILLRVLPAILLLGAVLVALFVFLDRHTWATSRSLSEALQNARSVTLVEYARDIDIIRRPATPGEITRLRNITRKWWRPFLPTSGYLCFDAHHRIEIVSADGSQSSSAISFLCEQFMIENGSTPVPLPRYLKESLTAFFTSARMAPKTYDEYKAIEEGGKGGTAK
jgi:hypothetical protein